MKGRDLLVNCLIVGGCGLVMAGALLLGLAASLMVGGVLIVFGGFLLAAGDR